MYMVFNAIYDNGFAVGFIYQVTNNAEKFTAPCFAGYSVSVFYCKHKLQIDLMISICHNALQVYVSSVRLSFNFGCCFQRILIRCYNIN